ncbi:LysM peptidoglycan-binding domain-containing protein [Sporolactobacillus vineae]|uniref:LysM peptidoglycan-binding domain-containing protein n=1 Tax=Sporolactobacillus vineae TaxID=444463 RepID=UPI00036F7575|nr:LysM peptidoglycan-binding domain-containing protein [Sporolactobacillus vineae]
MSQTSDDRLQFSINESVWLKDDAPAEEILSMALEPDITVEENRNDVTIRGYLRLSGEYRPGAPSQTPDQFQPAPFRKIDEIIETNEGTAVLEHHFPIDITIPSDRVPDLENLYVTIESFDYELTGQRHIQLQADIAITGLDNTVSERKEKPAAKAKPAEKAVPPAAPPKPVKAEKAAPAAPPKPFKAEKAAPAAPPKPIKAEKAAPAAPPKPVKAEKAAPAAPPKPIKAEKSAPAEKLKPAKEEKKAPVKKAEKAAVKQESAQPAPPAKSAVEAPTAAQKGKEAVKPAKAEKAQTSPAQEAPQPSAPVGKAGKKAAAKASKIKRSDTPEEDPAFQFQGEFPEMPTDRPFHDDDDEPAEFQYEAFRKPEAPEAGETSPLIAFSERSEQASQVSGQESSEPSPEPAAEETEKVAGSQYLTKVLSGEESEQRTAVKICIVQSGDSLESISERYHVPVTSLLRKNELASANIAAGEILYIPRTNKKGIRDE